MINRDQILSLLKSMKSKLDDFEVGLDEAASFLYSETIKELEKEIEDRDGRFHIFVANSGNEIIETLYDLEASDKVIAVIPMGYNTQIIVENTKTDLGFSKRQLAKLSPMERLMLANKKSQENAPVK